MRERRRTILTSVLCLLLSGCGGGSGSTGLISEGAVIDHVRETGGCDEFDGAPYCATDSPDATAPGGQSVSVVTSVPTPARTGTPAPTATPDSGGSPTPVPGPTSTPTAAPSPAPTVTPSDAGTVTAVVAGFGSGAACAVAGRPADGDGVWRLAALVALHDSATPVAFPIPAGIPGPRDLALLCFDEPPAVLPAGIVTLVDADPTVVFVLPEG